MNNIITILATGVAGYLVGDYLAFQQAKAHNLTKRGGIFPFLAPLQ